MANNINRNLNITDNNKYKQKNKQIKTHKININK